ncbi:hypothetical protein BN10_1080033 [Phycicoccus elongatus Lp2]|uniref:Uncharacterized protein n=1 Tax=Phycicoccus elongatus Lp2 TaxID=1193181 RepID=N0DZ81_9MICO|nr:hypothetical protein BN10_1080033 [Phycicoccus elongatus Lp2]
MPVLTHDSTVCRWAGLGCRPPHAVTTDSRRKPVATAVIAVATAGTLRDYQPVATRFVGTAALAATKGSHERATQRPGHRWKSRHRPGHCPGFRRSGGQGRHHAPIR